MLTSYATIDHDSVRPYIPDIPVLLPASSYYSQPNRRHPAGRLVVPNLPDRVRERAADCGGFVATFRWGNYRYTLHQYVQWFRALRPSWAATMDLCCEPEVAGGVGGEIASRQVQTTADAWKAWQKYREEPWA